MSEFDHLVKECLRKIDKDLTLYLNNSEQFNFSLLGRGGVILFYSLLSRADGAYEAIDRVKLEVDRMTSFIENSESIRATFGNGLAGMGWLLSYLNDKKLISIEEDIFFCDLDILLEKSLDRMISRNNFDFLFGSIGLGVFFLKRKSHKIIIKILEAIEDNVILIGDEIALPRYDRHFSKQNIFDFGLSHGNAGILMFLSYCYESSISPDLCKTLAYGIFRFFLKHIRLSLNEKKSIFPSAILVEKYNQYLPEYIPRPGYANGDLGILYALLRFAYSFKESAFMDQVLINIDFVCTQLKGNYYIVADDSFSHGSAGISYLLKKIYHITGEKVFHESSLFWMEKILSPKNLDKRLFYFYDGINEWRHFIDINRGETGVGIILADHLINLESDWDQCFLL